MVTSKEKSFFTIANKISKIHKVRLNMKKRFGPMPHNGVRIFSNKKLKNIMKNYEFTDVLKWIENNERMK